jgi:hypothetical protein
MDVAVRMNGEKLSIDPEDGYIGHIDHQCNLKLEVAGNESNVPFLVNRERDDKPIRLCEDLFGFQKIRVRQSKEGYYKTDSRRNNVRLLSLDYSVAPIVFTVAVVSQEEDFFVTCDKALKFGFDIDKQAWTYHTDWKSLFTRVCVITGRKVIQADREVPDFYARGNTGITSWWDSSSGVGAVWIWYEGKKIEVSVYWAEIKRSGRRAYLIPGEVVSYERVRAKQNPSGRSSSFKFELTGVTVVQ